MLAGRGRKFLVAATIVLPWRLRRFLYVRLLGWRLAPSARIGFSYVDAAQLTMVAGARIGHLNVVRNVALLHIGTDSTIGQWNWLTMAAHFDSPAPPAGGFRGLKLGNYSAIVSRHYIDCAGGITIGDDSVLAGVRSTLVTHHMDVATATESSAPIEIGDHCVVSSCVSVTPGAVIPNRCVVAMGAVVTGRLQEEGALYAGVPARVVRSGIDSGRFFTCQRSVRRVGPGERRQPLG